MNSTENLNIKLQNILTHYRITQHPVTGKSPTELIFNYSVRSKFSLMIPEKIVSKSNDIKNILKTNLKKGSGCLRLFRPM